MPVWTPRGLKIRFEPQYAFSLLARIWTRDERQDAYAVLKTTEAIEEVDGLLALVFALIVGGRMPARRRIGVLVRWNRAALEEWLARGCPKVRAVRSR